MQTVYGIWNREEDRWARTPSGRRFQTTDVDVALDSLAISDIDGEVREMDEDDLETFQVVEDEDGERRAEWDR